MRKKPTEEEANAVSKKVHLALEPLDKEYRRKTRAARNQYKEALARLRKMKEQAQADLKKTVGPIEKVYQKERKRILKPWARMYARIHA